MPEQNDTNLRRAVLVLSAVTLAPILATLMRVALWFWHPVQSKFGLVNWSADDKIPITLALGSLTATAGLSAVVICLLLRLRDHRNDLVTPPSLVGPIVVVTIGAALLLGAVMAN
jgi:hypothetical protein